MFNFPMFAATIPLTLFVGILACLEIGRRVAVRQAARSADKTATATATVDAAVFGLMGLLLAFTFSGAMQRWDVRRELVVKETNAIGTAWLRIDSLPADAQPALRDLFRRYLDARLGIYRALPDVDAARVELARSNELQSEIWSYSMAKCLDPSGEKARLLLMPALNDMIDITTTRAIALRTHTPTVILGALVVLTLVCSLLVGYGLAGGKPFATNLHMIGFALMMTVTIYVILDLDHPRVGLIRLDYVDQAMTDVRAAMK